VKRFTGKNAVSTSAFNIHEPDPHLKKTNVKSVPSGWT